MTEQIASFFSWLPGELVVFLISLLPIVELRGAIPIGALLFNLPFYTNYALSVVGNMLPIPFILLFIPKILDFLGKFKTFAPMVNWLRKKASKHSQKVIGKQEGIDEGECCESEEAKMRKMPLGVFSALLIFVAIPLPGTGGWTGALVAALFGLPKRWSLLSIFLGVLISGIIMALASYGVVGFLSFLI